MVRYCDVPKVVETNTGLRTPTPVEALINEEQEQVTQYRSIPKDDPKALRRFLNAFAADASRDVRLFVTNYVVYNYSYKSAHVLLSDPITSIQQSTLWRREHV